MFCTTCGQQMPDDGKFYPQCGTAQGKVATMAAPQPETQLVDVAANMFRGIESVGGRLSVTTQQLLFQPHALNIQSEPETILLSRIISVERCNTLGLVPNGMRVRCKDGAEYRFVV